MLNLQRTACLEEDLLNIKGKVAEVPEGGMLKHQRKINRNTKGRLFEIEDEALQGKT